VASYVQRISAAMAIQSAYATQNHMAHAKLKNHDGNFVDPTDDSVQAAAKVPTGRMRTASTWFSRIRWALLHGPSRGFLVLVHRQQKDADTGRAVLRFFDWGYRNGAAAAKELGYIPMPTAVVDQVEKTWEKGFEGLRRPEALAGQ